MTALDVDDLSTRFGVLSAPLGRRALAFVVDLASLMAISSPLLLLAPEAGQALSRLAAGRSDASEPLADSVLQMVVGSTVLFVGATAILVVLGMRGTTIGKRLLGLRLVEEDSLLRPGAGNALLRSAIVWLPGLLVPGLGALPLLASPATDRTGRRRGWHDRAAGVWLVDARRGLDPFDRDALRAAKRELFRARESAPLVMPSLVTGTPIDRSLTDVTRSIAGVVSPHVAESLDATPAATTRPVSVDPRAAEHPSPKQWAFVLDDGTRHPLPPRSLVGREPTAGPDCDGFSLTTLLDPAAKMSRTHLAIEVDKGRAWVSDLGSSNGTDLITPLGEVRTLNAHQRYDVAPGTQVRIGGRTLRFEKVTEL